jgi:hypothetical protein
MNGKERIDFLYLISHGFAARMILQTGLIDQLLDSGYNVAICCPDINDTNLKQLSENKGVELFDLYSDFHFDRNGNLTLLRMYVLEDISQNVALLDKHQKQLQRKTRNPWKRIRPHLFYAVHEISKILPGIKERYMRWEEKKYFNFDLQEKLRRINPKVVVSTYPVSVLEGQVLLNVKELGIKSVIHLLSWDNISCKGRFLSNADKYISWGPIMTSELQEYYNINRCDIFESGVAHYDLHYQAKLRDVKPYLLNLGLDPKLPFLLFGMSSPYFAPNEIDIVEQLSKWIGEGRFNRKIQLIVRPHPQNIAGNMADLSWLPRLKALKSEGVAVDFPELHNSNIPWSMQTDDMPKLSTLLAHSVVSINSCSTLSLDSLAVETPVILTSFDGHEEKDYWDSARRMVDFPHLKKMISYNAISVTYTFEELYTEIEGYMSSTSKKENERAETLRKHCGPNDGGNTERVISALTQIIHE